VSSAGEQSEESRSQQQSEEHELEQRQLAQAAEAGIHRLAIPTPFRVGRINAYLIEDSPLTLIDSGPNSAKALDELEQALAARGRRVEDIELLIVSHQHLDHFGLAQILARRSGAEVAAFAALAPYLADYSKQADADDAFAQKVMLRHGIPPEVVTALRSVSAEFRAWGAAVEVTRPLQDGSELVLRDRTLKALHRPGHSPSDMVFLDEAGSILFAADHLIKHISSNPLLTRPFGSGADYAGPRPQALLTYIDSLQKTRAMELSLVLPGHGPPIVGHAELIDQRMRMHDRRKATILRLIEAQPRTAHEIAHELWGNVAVTQAYLTLSEVLGHVDLLLADGSVVEVERDGVVRFAVV
jgi:glyoxylase-like metal-dependent hydrolase (beta-lactamase superfamily II)